jgi:hypothetical protein
MVQKGAPYSHPIFAALHAKVFFKTKMSLGNLHPHHFTNSIEGGDPYKCKVLLAMLELVTATASSDIPLCLLNANNTTQVHAALFKWANGYYQPTEFSYDRSSNIYDLHLKTLKSIFQFNIHGFHCTLSNLYQDAT